MLKTLFDPMSRLTPAQFNSGAIALIIAGAFFALVPMFGFDPSLVTLIGLLGYVTWYCWIVLFMGRYRDGGQDPVKCLIPIGVYIVVSIIATLIILWPVFMEILGPAIEASSQGQDQASIEAELEASAEEFVQGGGLAKLAPMLAATGAIVSALIAFGFNRLIGPSKFSGESTTDTFR